MWNKIKNFLRGNTNECLTYKITRHSTHGFDVVRAHESYILTKNGNRYYNKKQICVETSESTFWFKNGLLHRDDGPAIERLDGTAIWFKNGLLHREDGPARVIVGFTEEWWLNGKRHRLDGPALVFDKFIIMIDDLVDGLELYVDGIQYNNKLEYMVAVEQYKEQTNVR